MITVRSCDVIKCHNMFFIMGSHRIDVSTAARTVSFMYSGHRDTSNDMLTLGSRDLRSTADLDFMGSLYTYFYAYE